MLARRNIIFFALVFSIAATVNVSAQLQFWDIENDVAKTLLRQDLRQAVKDAENSPANDLKSLLRRLSLYRRAANSEKVALTARQIINHRDFAKNYSQINDSLENALNSDYFQDAETLRFYLQKARFSDHIYAKFVKLSLQNKAAGGVEEFDKWLAEKSSETEKKDEGIYSETFEWTNRRIAWRRQFGLDNTELLNGFVEDVRNNPTDLDAALRYVTFFKTSPDLLWLADIFSSRQSYDYYELGNKIGGLPNSLIVPYRFNSPQLCCGIY